MTQESLAVHIPAALCANERASQLARAVRDLLLLPTLPPEALPAVARLVGLAGQEVSEAAEVLGDMLGVVPATARHGDPDC